MKKTICFAATTPFAVNAFLRSHLLAFATQYDLVLCVNTTAYPLSADLVASIRIINIDMERKISPLNDVKVLIQLCSVFIQIRPDAVHSITPKAGLLAMFAAWLVGVPNRFHTFTGQVWANKTGLVRLFFKGFDRIIALLASRVFADSASQCRLLRDEGVVRDGEIDMLGPGSIAGVDLNRFHPDATSRARLRMQIGTAADVCVFLFVGRLARDKGVFDLIHAFQQLTKTVRNVELWVVGPDEEGLLQTLQETVVDCDAPIRWMGATPTPENFMASADVLLLPSYREGFGSAIIEGAACGIPAIAYRIDGVIDAVEDGTSGLLVEVGQPTAFSSAMKSLAFDRGLCLRLGNQALERARRDFSSQRVTDAWLDFYHSQLSKSDEAPY